MIEYCTKHCNSNSYLNYFIKMLNFVDFNCHKSLLSKYKKIYTSSLLCSFEYTTDFLLAYYTNCNTKNQVVPFCHKENCPTFKTKFCQYIVFLATIAILLHNLFVLRKSCYLIFHLYYTTYKTFSILSDLPSTLFTQTL